MIPTAVSAIIRYFCRLTKVDVIRNFWVVQRRHKFATVWSQIKGVLPLLEKLRNTENQG